MLTSPFAILWSLWGALLCVFLVISPRTVLSIHYFHIGLKRAVPPVSPSNRPSQLIQIATMADSKHSNIPSDDEKFAQEEKHHPISPPSSTHSRTPEAVAAEHGLSEKKLLRKLDRYLVPGVSILYLLSFLDRSNVANARLEGLEEDLGLSEDGTDYLNGLTLFFVGYISLEVVWNLILKKVGPRVWLPLIGVVWGVVSTLQGCVVNNGSASGTAGFLAVRFFLGLTEGGCFLLSLWRLLVWSES